MKRIKYLVPPIIDTMFARWQSPSEIPNQKGYSLVVQLKNDALVVTQVIQENGLHKLNGVSIADVVGWRPATPTESNL